MKSDVMERLLIDQALGRLDPDVDALLADHLANDPAATTQARELQDVVHLAAEAVRQPVLAIEPPGQIHRLVWRHRAEQALALAASFAIGVGITAAAFRANPRHDDYTAPLARAVQSGSLPSPRRDFIVDARIESLPFWSNQRLYALAQASAAGVNTKEILK
jgi:anti-sigma factor RsiW